MNTIYIKKLKDKVEYCLKNYEDTRNDDILLTIKIWEVFHPSALKQDTVGNRVIYLNKLFDLPREDNVKRIRAKIQNEDHKYLPTKAEVRRKRQISEDVWRNYLGYPVAGVDNQTL